MKIVVTGTRGFPNVQGGVEAHCEHLYPHLAALGCEVVVLTRRPYVDPSVEAFKNVKLLSLSCPKQKFLEAIVHTFKSIFKAKKLKADVLHVHAIGPALLVPLARLLGLKVVFTHHGPDYEREKWNAFAKMILRCGEWKGCRFSHEVISVSGHVGRRMEDRYKRKVHVIPNGVEIPQIAESEDALKKYGLEKGKYILTVGRFVPEKGFHDLIEAFKKTQDTGHKTQEGWKLVIVGDADHKDEYSRELKRKGDSGERIVLTGRLTGQPLAELYSYAGLFVLPSYHEGLPIVLLEAMSYGLSCLVSDIPANREVGLENQRHFKPGDIQELSGKLRAFTAISLNEDERRRQVEYIRKSFDWGEIAGRTLEVYRKV